MLINKKNRNRVQEYTKNKAIVKQVQDVSELNLKSDAVYFLPLGGTGEFGCNINLYFYKGKWIIVDIGVSFDGASMSLILPDISFIKSIPIEDILGIFITHAHYDHLGGLVHLWKYIKVPVYMTPFTANFFKTQMIDAKVKYCNQLHEVEYGQEIKLGVLSVTYRNTPHSVPDSAMLIIRTDQGSILHTGDWRSEEDPIIGLGDDNKIIGYLKNETVLAVVGDSTNAMTPDTLPSELEVQNVLMDKVKQIKHGRVVIVCFSTHVARILSCAKIAHECGRKLALVGRSLYRTKEVSDTLGYFNELPQFLNEDQAKDTSPDELMIVCTGSQGEDWSGLKRLSENEHPKIKLTAGDTVIVSARMIIGRERQIYDMINRFVKMGVNVITPESAKNIHVSGHPPQGDLKALYISIKPHWVIPVHGEYRHLYAHASFVNSLNIGSFIVDNGNLIRITKDKCEKVTNVFYSKTILDGNVLINKEGKATNERNALANGCIIVCIALYLEEQDLITAVKDIRFFGACEPKESFFRNSVRQKLDEILEKDLHLRGGNIPEDLQKFIGPKIRSELQRFIFKERGTDPQIFVSVLSKYTNSNQSQKNHTSE